MFAARSFWACGGADASELRRLLLLRSPTSPGYSPTSPAYSPTSPAYRCAAVIAAGCAVFGAVRRQRTPRAWPPPPPPRARRRAALHGAVLPRAALQHVRSSLAQRARGCCSLADACVSASCVRKQVRLRPLIRLHHQHIHPQALHTGALRVLVRSAPSAGRRLFWLQPRAARQPLRFARLSSVARRCMLLRRRAARSRTVASRRVFGVSIRADVCFFFLLQPDVAPLLADVTSVLSYITSIFTNKPRLQACCAAWSVATLQTC